MSWFRSEYLALKHYIQDRLKRMAGWYNRSLAPVPFVQLVFGVAKGLGDHLAADMAASIAYYAILSIFPLLLGIIAILGLILPRETVQEEIFTFFARYLPESTSFIENNIRKIISARGALGAVSVAGLIWTGSMIFGAINRVINKVWDISQFDPVWFRKPRDIGMALGMGLLFLVSILGSIFLSSLPVSQYPLPDGLIEFFNQAAVFLLAFGAFFTLFKLMPATRTYWRYMLPGSLLSTVLFVLSMNLFVYFVNNLADWELVYGTIGSVIAFLILVYLSAFIMIIGAEVSAEYSRMRQGIVRDARIHLPWVRKSRRKLA
ncbi:MAG: YihY/virulence factor BrkB family protein [Dehalococcoidaceae bacterium]|nr:YihY/virulence factor BrkB family protein [Dehalococcoidaceae bacterium]